MVTSFLGGGGRGGVTQLRTVKDMGERGVKKQGKSDDVLYGQPLCFNLFFEQCSVRTKKLLNIKVKKL